MDAVLQKFAGKIDAQSLVKTVEDIKLEYLDDGFTKEDIPLSSVVSCSRLPSSRSFPAPRRRSSSSVYSTTLLSRLMTVRRTASLRLFSRPWFLQWLTRLPPCLRLKSSSPNAFPAFRPKTNLKRCHVYILV